MKLTNCGALVATLASFVLVVLPGAEPQAAEGLEPRLASLSPLIGVWDYEDRSVADAGFEHLEAGRRTCGLALGGRFLMCRSVTRPPSRAREYWWLINYNEVASAIEMVAIFSDWGPKRRYEVRVTEAGRRLDLLAEPLVRQNRVDRSWATVQFDGPDRIVWETRTHRSDALPDAWRLITRDIARRAPASVTPDSIRLPLLR